MFDWIADHFSLAYWCANLDDAGGISILLLDADWLVGQHYTVTVGLLGFCGSLTYWVGGKFDETNGAWA